MLWLVWHMWILIGLAFAGGVIAGWVARGRSDETPERPLLETLDATVVEPVAEPATPEPAFEPEPEPDRKLRRSPSRRLHPPKRRPLPLTRRRLMISPPLKALAPRRRRSCKPKASPASPISQAGRPPTWSAMTR
jgi:hypothetical protein